jgi:hypothetical protein
MDLSRLMMERRYGFGRINVGNIPLSKQYPALCNIMRHKSDTIATIMPTSSPYMTFRRDLIGTRLDAWNALLQRLASI